MALYVVTGAAGFIGSHLVDTLLAEGHSVRGLDDFSTGKAENLPPACPVVRADVADAQAVARAMQGAAGCFHLAAVSSVTRSSEDWLGAHRSNQTGTIAVLDAARRHGGLPVIYASSAAVYGDLGRRVAREDMLTCPRTAYGADKRGSELHAAVAWMAYGVPTFGLRFFNVYGPRQDPSSPYTGVISIFARRIARGAPVTVHGDGQQVRDFIHVADVVAHAMAAMRRLGASPGAMLANVCTGRGTSVLDLVRILGDIHGRTPRVTHGPARPGDIRHSVGSPVSATALLGVAAGITLEQGLTALLGVESAAA